LFFKLKFSGKVTLMAKHKKKNVAKSNIGGFLKGLGIQPNRYRT